MRCDECPNKRYCPDIIEEPNLLGCSGGEPMYLPSYVAYKVALCIKSAGRRLGIDKEEYLKEIISEIRKQVAEDP